MEGNGHIATDTIVKLSGLSVVNSCLPWHFTRVNIKNDNSETSSIIYGPVIGVKYIFRVVSTCPCGCRFEILVNYGKELSQTLSGKYGERVNIKWNKCGQPTLFHKRQKNIQGSENLEYTVFYQEIEWWEQSWHSLNENICVKKVKFISVLNLRSSVGKHSPKTVRMNLFWLTKSWQV